MQQWALGDTYQWMLTATLLALLAPRWHRWRKAKARESSFLMARRIAEQTTTSLHVAAEEGNAETCRALVQAGAEVNATLLVQSTTPLHLAAAHGHADACRVLVNAGAKLEAIESHRDTPLHMAANNGHASAMAVLVEAGADVNTVSTRQTSPLHGAAQSGYADACKLLVDAGADVNARHDEYRQLTSLHLAVVMLPCAEF
jgi:ankyrin repeat protein